MLTDHTQAVHTLSPPETLQDLYHLVGLFNYYHDFIPNYASIASHLTSLLRCHKYQHSTKGMWQLVDSLTDLVLRKGWRPKVIITDSDRRLIGATSQRFAASIGAELCPSAPYHQQANPVECHIQTLQHVLQAFAMESTKDWVNILPAAELAINSTPSLTTEQTPFDLVYIIWPDQPLLPSVSDVTMEDHLSIAKACLESACQTTLQHLEANKSQYDMRHKPLHTLHVGAQWHAKLDLKKVGPFPIKQVLLQHHFKLDLTPLTCILTTSSTSCSLNLHPKSMTHLTAPWLPLSLWIVEVTFTLKLKPLWWQVDPHTTWEFEQDLLKDGCEAVIQDWNSKSTSLPAATANMLDSSLHEHLITFISTTTSPADAKLLGLKLEIFCLAWAVHHLQHVRGLAPETQLGTININALVMMTPRSGVSVDDDEVDGVGDEIGDVNDNEVDGVGDKVGGVNMSVQCVDLMLEVIPRPQWTTAFSSILIWTTNLLWVPMDVR
ncbi:uncharacterized protein UHOR_14147 [Ustilago hordei]|uniref:Integrase catalytic domain-containing protein n=1 Tax=Ustilago hordei TaxID=120017 RepID=I2FSW8_USTHO|nr:uncharacterized protein UHOR_14147 [Ustilago hordei]